MNKKDFNNKFNRVDKSIPEINSGEILVQTLGYIPKDKQIKMLIEAGKRIEAYRGTYDFRKDVDIENVENDPTRQMAFDLADMSEIIRGLKIKSIDINKNTFKTLDGETRDLETGEPIKSNQTAQNGPDTSSRSVSGQMTPKGGGIDEETKQDVLAEKIQKK